MGLRHIRGTTVYCVTGTRPTIKRETGQTLPIVIKNLKIRFHSCATDSPTTSGRGSRVDDRRVPDPLLDHAIRRP